MAGTTAIQDEISAIAASFAGQSCFLSGQMAELDAQMI
jgi:hypothetical protein